MQDTSVFVIIQKVYYPFLCAVGIPANLFTFYMIRFRKCGMSETAIIYLGSLAIMDCFYLIWVILLDLTLTFHQAQPFWHSYPWCGILSFLQYGSLYSSSWIVVVFTIERYLVLRITKAKKHFSKTGIIVFITILIILLCHIISIPLYWIHDVTLLNITMAGENVTVSRCLYNNKLYSTVLVWITTFLSGGIPIILVIVFNSLIAHHLQKARKMFTKEERRTMKGVTSKGMVKRTIMLLCTVSVTFVVLSLPRFVTYCILRTMYNYKEFNRNDYSLPINVISDLANMLQNLNSTTNFLLYCMVSRRFRQELLWLLTCKPKGRELGSFITQTTMKVFSVMDHKAENSRDSVDVVLTKLNHTQ
ncbi:probable G-protein coupled receptor 139 [Amia ocellicauda]|uniref:probable G-protein coupled receptor 139 n=1 Tax=Amia ocellicauda TaxID=2972642 RepID=UPI0034639D07